MYYEKWEMLTANKKLIDCCEISEISHHHKQLTKLGNYHLCTFHWHDVSANMPGNQQHIPKEQKWLITIMSAHLSNNDIAIVSKISEQTIHQVLKLWWETGDVIGDLSKMEGLAGLQA